MDALEYDTTAPVVDEYIGDDLTWEDLMQSYSAFLKDTQTEAGDLASVEPQ
jgi:hypothetical protein